MDVLVPAVPGFSYMGNGANDALNYFNYGDGISPEELREVLESRPPTGDLDQIAFDHDVGTIDPDTGQPRGTLGQIENDLVFTFRSLGAFFSDPIGNMFGLGMAAFGLVAAGFHALTGFAGDLFEAIGNLFSSLFDPIVLDLDGDGVELVDLDQSTASFDFDGDGIDEQIGWVGADDGLLVFDANGDGVIDQADEVAFVSYLEGAQTDLEGLAAFDTNGDGLLTEADAAAGGFDWGQFMVWQDRNQNGRSDAGELVSLRDAGIVSIDLHLNGQASEVAGNLVHNTTTFTRADGATGTAADVSFRAHTYGSEVVALDEDVIGIATDVGTSAILIGRDERDLVVAGTAGDDFIVFSEMDDVLLATGGEGVDTVVYAGEGAFEDFSFGVLNDEGLLAVTDTRSGETFFVGNDVEYLSIGGSTVDLTGIWPD